MADGAWRIDATTPAICYIASGNKLPMVDKIVGANTEMGGMNDPDTTSAEVARG